MWTPGGDQPCPSPYPSHPYPAQACGRGHSTWTQKPLRPTDKARRPGVRRAKGTWETIVGRISHALNDVDCTSSVRGPSVEASGFEPTLDPCFACAPFKTISQPLPSRCRPLCPTDLSALRCKWLLSDTFLKAGAESLKVGTEEGDPRGCWRCEGVRNLALTLSSSDSVFPPVKWEYS